MPSYARKEIVNENAVGVYYCLARCSEQSHLYLGDKSTDAGADNRTKWVERRLAELATVFAVDVVGYAVMRDRLEVVLRTRPDLANAWSDQEVAVRTKLLSLRRLADREPDLETQAEAINTLARDAKSIKQARKRLKSLSWFMRYLCEFISRRVNAEEGTVGRFWYGRFRSLRLLDPTEMLACLTYVDVNPIRARHARTPKDAKNSSAHMRVRELSAGAAEFKRVAPAGPKSKGPKRRPAPGSFLCEIMLKESSAKGAPAKEAGRLPKLPAKLKAEDVKAIRENAPPRASDRGYLPVSLDSYVKLLDWTAKQIREGKRSEIPSELAEVLETFKVPAERWLDTVSRFSRRPRRPRGGKKR